MWPTAWWRAGLWAKMRWLPWALSFPITMIFMAVALGSNTGCSVIISQLFGAKETARMKTAVSTSVIAILALSALLTAGGFLFCEPLMRLLGTPENVFADSQLYLNVYIGGLTFLFLYNICTGVFTALGDSRTPLYFLIASSLANIVMDVVFVVCFHMGVGGVAWATFLCQGVASVLAAWTLFRAAAGRARAGAASAVFLADAGAHCAHRRPQYLQQSFISVGNLFIQSLVNSFGSAVVAGYSAAVKLNTFALTGFTTLGNGLSSFTAQNIGAGRPERVKQGFRAGAGMTLCVAVPFIAAFVFAGPQMVRLFLSAPSADALAQGTLFLNIVAPFYVLISLKLAADGVLRGAGCMGQFMTATFTDLILRVILAFLLAPRFGAAGIWMSWPLGWAVAAALSLGFYFTGGWRKRVGSIDK